MRVSRFPLSTGRSGRVPGARRVVRAGGESRHRTHRPHLHQDRNRRDVCPAAELLHHRCQPGAQRGTGRPWCAIAAVIGQAETRKEVCGRVFVPATRVFPDWGGCDATFKAKPDLVSTHTHTQSVLPSLEVASRLRAVGVGTGFPELIVCLEEAALSNLITFPMTVQPTYQQHLVGTHSHPLSRRVQSNPPDLRASPSPVCSPSPPPTSSWI